MATLPRVYSSKQRTNISSPFSTSPRKLQEMTLPDGTADVTSTSGISMKQYEEQLNGLKKENFHLKLRIYFLEEKLGSGAPPAVQGLLEHNVRLQVELEELKRQLTDKQQLLAAAAEAIDVLEQQGSISLDSEEGSLNGSSALKRRMQHLEDQVDGSQPNRKAAADESAQEQVDMTEDSIDGISIQRDQEELLKLRREYHKALQMIQGCTKRIQQQDKQMKKLKAENDVITSQVSDTQKYEEILRCKEEHIQDLEQKIKNVQCNGCNQNNDSESGNLQELLTRRLQGLAYFLDKLLSHKCVLGEDKKKLAESLLEQSLALPVGLKLDETMAPDDLTMDESALDVSHSLRMEDLTLMFGHHVLGDASDKLPGGSASRPRATRSPRAEPFSESECWSEPDRNVSLARIGLGDAAPGPRLSACDELRPRARRARVSEPRPDAARDDLERLAERARLADRIEAELTAELEAARLQVDELTRRRDELAAELASQRSAAALADERAARDLQAARSRCAETELQLAAATGSVARLRAERQDLEEAFAETERALRRAADEAALQASEAALERSKAHHERMRAERDLEEVRARLAAAQGGAAAKLQALRRTAAPTAPTAPTTDDERPTSPDQGIDSDRLSSLELADAVSFSPRSLYQENEILKQKLERTKATLADTLVQLNAANMRKRNVQRAICREIHKTQGVLRKARDQFESQN